MGLREGAPSLARALAAVNASSSLANRDCSQCGYLFRGRDGGMPSSSGTTPRNTPTGLILPPPLSPDLGGAVSQAHQELSPATFPNTPNASNPSTPRVTGADHAEIKAEMSGPAAVGDGDFCNYSCRLSRATDDGCLFLATVVGAP